MSEQHLGVVIVAFNSAPVIAECLESLFASRDAELAVVIVDNNSEDGTVAIIEDWANGTAPFVTRPDCPIGALGPVAKPVPYVVAAPGDRPDARLTIVRSPLNSGFAGAVNQGLAVLAARADVGGFWILNPDCVVPPDTAGKYLAAMAQGPFGLLGCRTIYYERPDQIQVDGGQVNPWTGVCRSVNAAQSPGLPLPDAAGLDYLTGANMVVSRVFLDQAGPMPEQYFLYYEEVDWAAQRGALPIRLVADAVVYHHGGTVIGTASSTRRGSPFANYFNYRNRLMFARRHMPRRAPLVWLYAVAKAGQLLLLGAPDEARAILAGVLGLRPPPSVTDRIKDPAARRLAFGTPE